MSSQILTLSQLPEITADQLSIFSYIEAACPTTSSIVQPSDEYSLQSSISDKAIFQSKKINIIEFAEALWANEFKERINNTYNLTINNGDGTEELFNGALIYANLRALINGQPVQFAGNTIYPKIKLSTVYCDDISDLPKIEFAGNRESNLTNGDFKTLFCTPDNYIVSGKYVRTYLLGLTGISDESEFKSTLNTANSPTTSEEPVNTAFTVDGIKSGILYNNKYIFRFENSTTSNTWTSPQSGWFTCYGWVSLDEQSRSSYFGDNFWIALEIKNSDDRWNMLQVNPIIFNPDSDVAYISFNLPIRAHSELRCSSGIKIPSNQSAVLSNSSTNGITNNLQNAFLGGVFSIF